MAELEVKSFEVKAADEFGTITGYAGVFDVLDRGNDILKKGALGKKSIKVPMMANHHEGVIGHAIVTEDEKGLHYVGKLAVDSKSQKLRERAEEWYYAVKEGHVDRNSFGYIPLEAELVRKKINGREVIARELKRIDLVEVSIVPVPMNPYAGVSSVKALDEKAASGSTDLPLADRGRAWDADAAVARVREWAGGPDKESINWSRYRRAFFWYDSSDPENFGSYKLPFADVINGRLMAVPRGIFAAAAAVQGARGGVNIPSDDLPAVRRKIAAYYRKMGETPPWEDEKSLSEALTRLEQRLFDLEKKLVQAKEGQEKQPIPKKQPKTDISFALLKFMGRL